MLEVNDSEVRLGLLKRFLAQQGLIGQMGTPVSRLKTNRNACLVGCAIALVVRPLICMSNRIGGPPES